MTRVIAIAGAVWLTVAAGTGHAVDWVNETNSADELQFVTLQFPPSMNASAGEQTPEVFGRVFHAGVTAADGGAAQVVAQLGWGPQGSDPRDDVGWQWVAATFNLQQGNDDEYKATFQAGSPGTYAYTFRFSLDGTHFTAADLDGAGSNASLTFSPADLGVLTVPPLVDVLDVDGDGSVEALTDGLLLLRYMFGFRGATLITGVVDTQNCSRCTALSIEGYLAAVP